MRKPKLLMVSGSSPPIICGIGDYTANLLHTYHYLRPDWNWTWLSRRSRWFNSPISSYKGLRMIRSTHTWNPFGTEVTTALIRWLKPDLIHIQDQIHSYFETDAAVQIAKAAKCPVVVTLHEFHHELSSVQHTIQLVKAANIVIANDARTSDRCREYTGRIPDLQGWSPANVLPEPETVVKSITGLVTTFGLISPIKQLPIVFEALQFLRQQGLNLRWRIIGPFHPETDSYHSELAERFNVSWVEFTGEFNNLNDKTLRTLLAQTDIMILPFADGASPRRTSLQAAWAFGLPVITTLPSAKEPEIQNGVNCLLVEESTSQAWGTAIKSVFQNRQLREQLAIGSHSIAKHFSWERLANLHLEIFQNLLNEESVVECNKSEKSSNWTISN
ncbi:glycosyltransferase family 4 protein [Chlorogloeopsis sp. ULAP01]|uniref:glycosyltransferase family 4 protein n=1 Tax=Chlorogloeopsis sp. ULAP01 TaxID=3056483 RepID=UPI0025AAE947|nr:glycosyltransferase family 4 protein [Chlorogloeopsis sp. ULAP01]MDM9383274.1 glycosyltransferase family 4 protein [Chlorogloeopsis sp. ULAP01]